MIAYPLAVLVITGSSTDAGWAGFAAIVPAIIIYLPAGALVERLTPRRVMSVSEIVRGAAAVAIIAELISGRPSVWLLVLAAAVGQSCRVFFELAERRLTSSLLEHGQEAAGLALSETWRHVAVLLGRPLGGFLFGLGRVLPFAADSLSFSVAVVSLLGIKGVHGSAHPAERGSGQRKRTGGRRLGPDIATALRWLRADPFARKAMIITAGTTFIAQALIMVFLAGAESRHLPPLEVGLVLAASGAGGVLGSSVAPWLFSRLDYLLLPVQTWVWFEVLILLALFGGNSSVGMALAMVLLGCSGAIGNVAVDGYLVRVSAGDMFARLVSVYRLTSLCAMALGPLVGGVVMQDFGTRLAEFLFALIAALLAAIAFLEPSMRFARAPSSFSTRRAAESRNDRDVWSHAVVPAPRPSRPASSTAERPRAPDAGS